MIAKFARSATGTRPTIISVLIGFQLFCSFPAFIYFMSGVQISTVPILTIILIGLITMASGIVAGLLFWFTIAKHLSTKQEKGVKS